MKTLEKIVLGTTLAAGIAIGAYCGYRNAESKQGYAASQTAGDVLAGAATGALAVLIGYYQFFCSDKDKSNKTGKGAEADSE